MYNEFFGFKESPFAIAPDPRYLYMSEQHREALAHLLYGLDSDGGFVLLTGEVGTGKTTVCRCLLEQIPEQSSIAFILNPRLTVSELLATVCDEFGITYPEGATSIKVFTDLINRFLIDACTGGRRPVLIIDEAQNLSTDILEQLRLLTNLETTQHKLLQVILLGQPELRDKLAGSELRQLSQRVVARYHLNALTRRDVNAYVRHRLTVAGGRKDLFSDSAINALYKCSNGIPRLINLICDRALLGAFVQEKQQVSRTIVRKGACEVMGEADGGRRKYRARAAAWLVMFAVLVVFGAVLATTYYKKDPAVAGPGNSPPVTAPAREKPELPVTDSIAWPDSHPIQSSRQMAFESLFERWGKPYPADGGSDFCSAAASYRLGCLSELGTIPELRGLNRPAVLKLIDDSGREYYIMLSALKEDIADIVVAGEKRRVSVQDIVADWFGDFTLFWKTPDGYSGEVKSGDRGSAVAWLGLRMNLIRKDSTVTGEPGVFDDTMSRAVRRFQVASGLKPDGIVGTKTVIHLNSATDSTIPLLNEIQRKGQ